MSDDGTRTRRLPLVMIMTDIYVNASKEQVINYSSDQTIRRNFPCLMQFYEELRPSIVRLSASESSEDRKRAQRFLDEWKRLDSTYGSADDTLFRISFIEARDRLRLLREYGDSIGLLSYEESDMEDDNEAYFGKEAYDSLRRSG